MLRALRYMPLALALTLPSAAAAPDLRPPDFPADLPSTAVLAGWQRMHGRAETADASVSYELYVDPARNALYRITRFSLETTVDSPAGRIRRLRPENLLFNSRPGERFPLLCYERVATGWKTIAPGTPEYQQAMMAAMFVYGVHRAATARQ